MYYLGAAGVIQVGNIRIGGVTGIYKSHDYNRAHTEQAPFHYRDIRSVYHVRKYDTYKLFRIREPIDIMLSHDWPANIEHYGDTKWLFAEKPFIVGDSKNGELGSPPAESLLKELRPRYWFSAHMHVKFAALVDHEEKEEEGSGDKGKMPVRVAHQREGEAPSVRNPDELDLEMDDAPEQEASASGPAPPLKNPGELDLDMDDQLEQNTGVSNLISPTKNSDELGLEMNEPPPPEDKSAGLDKPPVVFPATNPAEIELDGESDGGVPLEVAPVQEAPKPPESTLDRQKTQKTHEKLWESTAIQSQSRNRYTRFLALDKVLPRREFLQITTIDFAGPLPEGVSRTSFRYDPEWLAITRATSKFPPNVHTSPDLLLREPVTKLIKSIDAERQWVEENIIAKGKLEIPRNFQITAPVHVSGERVKVVPDLYWNNQTGAYCDLVGIPNWVWLDMDQWKERLKDFGPENTGQLGHGTRGRKRGGDGGRGRGKGRGRGRGR